MALIWKGVTYPVDFVARHTGYRGYIPLILVHLPSGEAREAYRGEFYPTAADALERAQKVWDQDLTGTVREFKRDSQGVL